MTQILIDIQPATMRVYQAEAARRGMTGQELIAALLADWPAILALVAHEPKGAVTGALDFPSGSGY